MVRFSPDMEFKVPPRDPEPGHLRRDKGGRRNCGPAASCIGGGTHGKGSAPTIPCRCSVLAAETTGAPKDTTSVEHPQPEDCWVDRVWIAEAWENGVSIGRSSSAPSLVLNSVFRRPSISRAKPDLGSSIVWPDIRGSVVVGGGVPSGYGESCMVDKAVLKTKKRAAQERLVPASALRGRAGFRLPAIWKLRASGLGPRQPSFILIPL
jgi:hypothetical protein